MKDLIDNIRTSEKCMNKVRVFITIIFMVTTLLIGVEAFSDEEFIGVEWLFLTQLAVVLFYFIDLVNFKRNI